MRIVSLIPSSTEIVYLLGLGDRLVGRSHDSDYPPEVLDKPIISDAEIGSELASREIDEAVEETVHTGRSLFHLDQERIEELDPDLILTQELCDVCAPTFDQVEETVRIMEGDATILSLEPETIWDVLDTIKTVGRYTGREEEAEEAVKRLTERLDRVQEKVHDRERSVVVLEWLDPLMTAGHWVPELVEMAGGRTLLSETGEKSGKVSWEEVRKADPECLIVSPCGFDIDRAKEETHLITENKGWNDMKAVREGNVFVMDGDAYLTRSGPRLVEATEILGKILHPEVFGEPGEEEAYHLRTGVSEKLK